MLFGFFRSYGFFVTASLFVGCAIGIGVFGGIDLVKAKFAQEFGADTVLGVRRGTEKLMTPEISVPPESGELNGIAVNEPTKDFGTDRESASNIDNDLLKRIETALPKVKKNEGITAESFLVADLDSGSILTERNIEDVLPIASVTKLVRAIVAKERFAEDDPIRISREAVATYGTAGSLVAGEEILVRDLLYALLIESSNDAAEAIAIEAGRIDFLRAMNAFAVTIGMDDTYFKDASGLSPDNRSNARDLLKLARYIMANKKELLSITKTKTYRTKQHVWNNTTLLLALPAYAGGKNGFTDEALRTALSFFDVKGSDGRIHTLVVVVLRSSDREGDGKKLLQQINS